ncbi:MAG: TIGR00730 family Rossman fold protein [Acutalibacteraceae bacterium]|nr:TIGR00730 family Rossman fold protein [Acutalibacteraceae bacterium]
MRICVYGAASPTIDNIYKEMVEHLGKTMVQRGHSLVFGGGGNGLMGAVAKGVHSAGGHIIGVVPQFFLDEKIEAMFEYCNEMILTETMRERKQTMEDYADAFIIVPGGIGTYEEFFEILTLKQLCRHNKPIAVYNIKDYYNEIDIAMKEAMRKNFIKDNCDELYELTDDLEKLFEYIENPHQAARTVKELKDG